MLDSGVFTNDTRNILKISVPQKKKDKKKTYHQQNAKTNRFTVFKDYDN